MPVFRVDGDCLIIRSGVGIVTDVIQWNYGKAVLSRKIIRRMQRGEI